MNQNKVSNRREVIARHPFTKRCIAYSGDSIHAITSLGIVVALTTSSRMFIPWSDVLQFVYDVEDADVTSVLEA